MLPSPLLIAFADELTKVGAEPGAVGRFFSELPDIVLLGRVLHRSTRTPVEKEPEKKADDPNDVMLPHVKGLPSIRNNGPRLTHGTKGQVPVNPFSGNWVKPPRNPTEKEAASALSALDPASPVFHQMLGLGAIGGTGYLGLKSLQAIRRPWDQPAQSGRGAAALVHGARGGQYATGVQPEQLLSALR